MKEYGPLNQRPQNAKELYNYRHSGLRNEIERIFGVAKKRFQILVVMKSYDFPFQCDLVLCALMLHNFIRSNQLYEDEYNIPEAAAVGGGVNNDDDDDDVEEVLGNNHALKQWRLDIATVMWDDYVIYANEAGYVSEDEDEDI